MLASSTSVSGGFAWRIIACAALTALGLTGCVTTTAGGTGAPGASDTAVASDTQSTEGSVSPSVPPAKPEGSLGPTEQPQLPVVEGKLDETITLSTGFTVTLDQITGTTVEAETPGDVAGPAVAVVITVTNTSAELQNVDSAVVTLETADGELGIPTIAGGPSPLQGDLAPQSSAEGRYLFMLDPNTDRDVIINVNYAAGEPVAKFTGRTP